MTTPAVTEDAPAVSEAPNFLPTDQNYRMTGQLPEEKKEPEANPEIETGAEVIAPPGDKGDETAAASEAAHVQEKKEVRPKTEQTSESRWAKITRENRELRDRLARVEGAQSANQRETKQAPQPAAEAKGKAPTQDDKDDKGEFKYKTVEDFYAALADYRADQKIATFKEEQAKAVREREQQQAEETIQRESAQRVAKARKDHPDYDEIISSALALKNEHNADLIFLPKGSAVDGFIIDSPRGIDVLYEICKNADQHAAIFARDVQGKFVMNPVRQLRELAKIEHSLEGEKPAVIPAKPVTAAPRPPNQVSGKGTVSKDAVEQAVEDNDSAAYMREKNAQILARLKKGK